MEKLEIMSGEFELNSLRCKGWCHDYIPKASDSEYLPSEKYFD